MPITTDVDMRDRAVVAFIAVTGIRDRAVAALRLKHIDLAERLVTQDPKEVPTKFSKRIEKMHFITNGRQQFRRSIASKDECA